MCGPSSAYFYSTIYGRVKRLTKRMTSRRGGRVSASRRPRVSSLGESRGFTTCRVSYGCECARGRSGSKRSRDRLKRAVSAGRRSTRLRAARGNERHPRSVWSDCARTNSLESSNGCLHFAFGTATRSTTPSAITDFVSTGMYENYRGRLRFK